MLAASLPPLPCGGAEMQALLLGKTLQEEGVQVSFVTPGKAHLKGQTLQDGMTIYRLHAIVNTWFDWLASIKKKRIPKDVKIEYDDATELTDIIATKVGWPTRVYYTIFYWQCLWLLWRKRKQIDIIHAHTMEWSAIVATRLGKALGKPVVIKDSTMNGFKSLARFPNGKLLQQRIMDYAHFVAMTSIIGKNLQAEAVPPRSITYIPNGLPVVAVPEKKTHENQTVLFVGNLYQQPAKGVDILLKAWATVIREFPKVRLQVIGDGDRDMYTTYVHQKGMGSSVSFLGRVSNTRDYLAAATVFVLPSRREGMSNALMEAMLFELPCVATDISGSNDLIQNNVNGIIVPPANVQALADGIIYILRHPQEARAMGQKAREKIINEYDIRVVAQKYYRLYQTLIAH